MRVRSLFSSYQAVLTFALASAGPLVACASPNAGSTTLTAADVPASQAEPAPSPANAPEPPVGQLVCRTKSPEIGTAELFLEWKGTGAKGTLRRVAPSGNVTVQNVRAERHKGAIIADETTSSDLAVHAATVRQHQGKQRIRLGDWKQPWTVCE
jgi:hypothetical protein